MIKKIKYFIILIFIYSIMLIYPSLTTKNNLVDYQNISYWSFQTNKVKDPNIAQFYFDDFSDQTDKEDIEKNNLLISSKLSKTINTVNENSSKLKIILVNDIYLDFETNYGVRDWLYYIISTLIFIF